MPTRKADAVWRGTLKDGDGVLRLGGGAFEGVYSFASRFEQGGGTNPEELLAAAHAGCFSMALSHALSESGFPPDSVHTTARVHLEKQQDGFAISKVELDTRAKVPGIDEATFQREAEGAKNNCPVSKLFASAEITLTTHLST